MKNKKIGIFGWKTGDNSYGVTISYYEFFNNFGDVHIISPITDVNIAQYDLIVSPGGADVSPNTYGHIPSMFTGKPDPIKEYFDKYILPEVVAARVPLFGICRGHQAIAVHFGGYLIQSMVHETNDDNRQKLVHDVKLELDGMPSHFNPLKSHPKADKKIRVNSMHHQIVDKGSVSNNPDIIITGTHAASKEYIDTYVESLFYPNHNIITVQWHPEEIWDKYSVLAVEYLLSLSTKKE